MKRNAVPLPFKGGVRGGWNLGGSLATATHPPTPSLEREGEE